MTDHCTVCFYTQYHNHGIEYQAKNRLKNPGAALPKGRHLTITRYSNVHCNIQLSHCKLIHEILAQNAMFDVLQGEKSENKKSLSKQTD